MKSILLIGEKNDVLKDLAADLSSYFDLQHSFGDWDFIQNNISAFEPDLIIFSTVATYQVSPEILGNLEEEFPHIPVLLICSSQHDYNMYCPDQNHERLIPPVNRSQILGKCAEFLHIDNLEKVEKPALDRKSILIVDDCAMMLRSIKKELEKEYDIRVAPSGEKALSMMKAEAPDLVMLDYLMGGMNGRQVFETMLSQDNLKNIPVVFLTSVAEKKQIIDVLASKPAGYILKPPDYEQVNALLHEILG